MLDLQKYFGKDLFNGKDFLQKYKPAIEDEWKDIPPPEGTTSSRTRTTTTPLSEQEVVDWEEKHLLWKRANSQLKGFMQLTLTHELYIPIKDMTARFRTKLPTYFEQLNTVNVKIPELVKALILVQAIPKVWEAAASKSRHDYSHKSDDDNANSNNGNNNIKVSRALGSKPGLTLNHIQDAIMFASRLTAVKRGGTNTPFFQQQQCPRPPQRQQQCGQQQQQKHQQRFPPSNQDKGKKKKKQQGTRGGINRDAGNSGGNNSGNHPYGHSHFASVASTITPPFSSITKRKDWVALNTIEQSLRAEIATKPDNLWAGYRPQSTWDETYPDLNFKAASCLPSSHARGSTPLATFKGFWDKSCDSTLTQPPPPAKKKNLATMQKFTGFKLLESVIEDVHKYCSLADRIGVPKTVRYLKPLEDVMVTKACHTDQLASKACSSLQERIGAVAFSSKRTLEDNDRPRYLSTSSSKCARSIDPDEDDDVEIDDGNDLTSLFGDDVDSDIGKAAGVEEDVPDNVSLGSFYNNLAALD
ncbi:hypothetical protein PQX77_017248 [Marasmius sp. AFHP31]|nr:hypothetical protein PQX77_017248 [Marasmius sp. AFHP31]